MVPWPDSPWVTSSLTLGWTILTSDPEEATLGRQYLPTLQMEKLRLRYLSWHRDPSLSFSVPCSRQCVHVCLHVCTHVGVFWLLST